MSSFPSIPNADLAQKARADEQLFQNFRLRQIGACEEPFDTAFPETSVSSVSPGDVITLDRLSERFIPVKADRVTFAAEVKNDTGSDTGLLQFEITQGATVLTSLISILAGDTAFVFKETTRDISSLTLPGMVTLEVSAWRIDGTSISVRHLGCYSYLWNSET